MAIKTLQSARFAGLRPTLILAAAVAGLFLSIRTCDTMRASTTIKQEERTAEIALFEGGYGIYWHQKVAAEYNQIHAAEKTGIWLWGEPRVEEKVKPRILRGDPPALVLTGNLPIWRLIAAEKLIPFDSELAQPAHGAEEGREAWGELFIPGTLSTYTSDGHVYAVPSAFSAWTCWYDARQFREHGWEAPATWEEFTALCAQIKSEGVAPLAFQGKYPLYGWFTYISLIQRVGGLRAINRINALERGAFSEPASVRAAKLTQEMGVNFFQKGAMAMTHTESQLQFINNDAAMIFCGIWLENEMKENIPPGFELRCFNVPAVAGGSGNPRMLNGSGGEFLFAFNEGQNTDVAMDFARFMISPANAPDMARSIGVISPLRGATPREAVTPALQSALDIIEDAEGIFDIRLRDLFLSWTTQIMTPMMGELLSGRLTPEEFCAQLDAGVAAEVANPDVAKPPYVPLDPVSFGEAP